MAMAFGMALLLAVSACQQPQTGSGSENPPKAEDPGRASIEATSEARTPSPSPTPAKAPPSKAQLREQLTKGLQKAVDETRFDKVNSFSKSDLPAVDTAVIQLDKQGRPVAAANVLLNDKYPSGKVVPVDGNLAAKGVHWQHFAGDWGQSSRVDTIGDGDANISFTSPYPASILKLVVGFGVMRLVDSGEVSLDERYTYRPTFSTSFCGGGGETARIRDWFDKMITVSDNHATCAMIRLIQLHGAVRATNSAFRKLGLTTMQLDGTEAGTGRLWREITMTSLDTARLLMIVNGSPGKLWTAPNGKPVVADEVLGKQAREFFYQKLSEQGLNQMISTANYCGRTYPAKGIPQRVPDRWIDKDDGTVEVNGRYYGDDIRSCNAKAEVTFAHKTGLVADAAGDAGIVRSLPGKAERNYIVVVFTNLGQAGDPNRTSKSGTYGPAVTERLAMLGAAIDKLVTQNTAAAAG
ncbi:serine hydrolase [Flindersiella endophytica]